MSENIMRYKNYVARVEYSPEDRCFVGRVLGTRDVIGFHGESVAELEQDFREHLGGMKVKLTQSNEKGKGKLVIAFSDHAEFERIYAAICENPRSQSAAS